MTQGTRHIIVVGAGIVGVSAAIWLRRDGHEVTLVDRAGPGEGTSFGNGGVLAACAVVPVTVPGLLRKAPHMLFHPEQPLFLKWRHVPRLLPWLRRYMGHANDPDVRRIARALTPILGASLSDHQELAAGTPARHRITPCDYLYAYRDRRHFEADAFGWGIRAANGFAWDELEGRALRDFDPALSEDLGFAVRLPGHGRITDPGRYVKDLAAHFQSLGGRVLRADVSDIVQENGRVTGLRATGEILPCDTAVFCTGAWSRPLARKLGIDVPLESERGYHVDFVAPNMAPKAPVMVASGKFVATPMEGRLRVAGTVEFGGLEPPASRAPLALLRRQAVAAFPGLAAQETREWMGHRPAPADSIPIIGASPTVSGAYLGFGHHHVGLTGGPKTGRLLAQLISGRRPDIDMGPYSPARFAMAGNARQD